MVELTITLIQSLHNKYKYNSNISCPKYMYNYWEGRRGVRGRRVGRQASKPWWYIPIITPAFRRLREEDQGQPGYILRLLFCFLKERKRRGDGKQLANCFLLLLGFCCCCCSDTGSPHWPRIQQFSCLRFQNVGTWLSLQYRAVRMALKAKVLTTQTWWSEIDPGSHCESAIQF